jgi:poly-beta-1,6-N-acetyl-D-glucosamine synthase
MSPSYVVVTPARNEARFIERTLRSMAGQTVRPLKWVVVSDGSTDGTDEIVKKYVREHTWIELLRMSERGERHFSGKVQAFAAGHARLQGLPYAAIASLDADISFDPQYFEFLLEKLAANPELGLVGTPFQDGEEIYDYRFVNIEHVSGACQLFRRQCFEEIGGYIPIKGGGIDYVAALTARMKGWKTRTFAGKVCHHHREMGTAQHGVLEARFRVGNKDYVLGSHPIWFLFRTVYQMSKWPWVVGALWLAAGYVWAWLRGLPRPISPELVAFRREEEMRRLRRFFLGRCVTLTGAPGPAAQ